MSFMMANIPENPEHLDRQIDYILLAGMGPFLMFGNWVIKSRLAHMECKILILMPSVCYFTDSRDKGSPRE